MTNVEIQALETLFPAPLGQKAVAYWLPIAMREKALAAYRAAGIPVRIRYRGSRVASVGREMPTLSGGTYKRNRYQAQSYCLRDDATHFSIYNR